MSARRTSTAIMLAIMLGQAVPSSAQDAVRSPKDSATDTGDAFYCGERRLGYWFYCVRPKPAPPETAAQQSPATGDTAERVSDGGIIVPPDSADTGTSTP